MKLFFSYGHDENDPIVSRLQKDLSPDHSVWIDKFAIRAGDDWRHKIIEGLGEVDLVFGFLSKHSVRDPGVCRDELSIALGPFGKPVATILLEPDAEPPISISHVHWIDMTAWKTHFNTPTFETWYAEKLSEIHTVLASDQIQKFAAELKSLRALLKPVEHSALVDRLVDGFVGRNWLFDRLRDWQKQNPQSRMLWVSGAAGTGKSAFMASLAYFNRANVIGINLCDYKSQDRNNAHQVIRTLAYQIATRIADYRSLLLRKLQTLENPLDDLSKKNAHDLFDYLLVTIRTLDGRRSDDRCLVLIDALDETFVAQTSELMEVLAKNAQNLPSWLAIVVSSRPEEAIKNKFSGLKPLEIEAGSSENQADIQSYIAAWLDKNHHASAHLKPILDAAEGNFLYVRTLTEAVGNGTITLGQSALPGGLMGLYRAWFDHRFATKADYVRLKPALEVLLAAQGLVPEAWLLTLSQLDYDDLAPLGSLIELRQDGFGFFHKSLRDWLASPENRTFGVSPQTGQDILFSAIWPRLMEWVNDDQSTPDDLDAFIHQEWANLILTAPKPDLTERLVAAGGLKAVMNKLNSLTLELESQNQWQKAIIAHQALAHLAALEDSDFGLSWQAFGLEHIGEIYNTLGNLDEALKSFQNSLNIRKALCDTDPSDTKCQRNLSVSYNKIGQIYQATGRLDDALALYQDSQNIAKALCDTDRSNTEWQRDLSVSYKIIAEIYKAKGRLDDALALYQDSQNITKALCDTDRSNTEWQRDLSVSYGNIADIYLDTMRFSEAQSLYQEGLKIAKSLCDTNRSNTEWQRDLSAYNDRTATLYQLTDQLDEALSLYQDNLKTHKALCDTDPSNTKWQLSLSVSYNNCATIYYATGRLNDAFPLHQDSLNIAKGLCDTDPSNTDWQCHLGLCCENIAILYQTAEQLDKALTFFQKALNVRIALCKIDPSNTVWQLDLSNSYNYMANFYQATGREEEATSLYQDSLIIAKALCDTYPSNMELQTNFAVAQFLLGCNLITTKKSVVCRQEHIRGAYVSIQKLKSKTPTSEILALEAQITKLYLSMNTGCMGMIINLAGLNKKSLS